MRFSELNEGVKVLELSQAVQGRMKGDYKNAEDIKEMLRFCVTRLQEVSGVEFDIEIGEITPKITKSSYNRLYKYESLPVEVHKEIVRLYNEEHLSKSEIARRLGISRNTVLRQLG